MMNNLHYLKGKAELVKRACSIYSFIFFPNEVTLAFKILLK